LFYVGLNKNKENILKIDYVTLRPVAKLLALYFAKAKIRDNYFSIEATC